MNDSVLMDEGLRWLVLDLNAFFASCEAQERPELRGQPVAVVPVMAETTCAIAASYAAKARGVRTGTPVWRARELCPNLRVVVARPKLYVQYHHRILEAIDTCIPVDEVMSIDEVACRLDKTQRSAASARELARRIKTVMRERVGDCLTCSIGFASNKLLAKLASDMQKPDGLVVLRPCDFPQAIEHLAPEDICGVGPRMATRLRAAGIVSMTDLWAADSARLRRVWNGVNGARFHALLHGVDLPSPAAARRSLGHQHVLAPDERTMEKAAPVIRHLLLRAAQRLRDEEVYARRLVLEILWARDFGFYADDLDFHETQDTRFLLDVLGRLWEAAPRLSPLRVGVTLADLVPATQHQLDLFADTPPARAPRGGLSNILDRLNERFGRGTVLYASALKKAGEGAEAVAKISFHRVPGMGEF